MVRHDLRRAGPLLVVVVVVLALLGVPTVEGGDGSTNAILREILKEYARQRAERLVSRALGPRAAELVKVAHEVKRSGGSVKDTLKQSFLEALLGGTGEGPEANPASSPKMVSAFQGILGRAPGADGSPPRRRRGLLNDPQVQALAGLVLAHSGARGEARQHAKTRLLDAMLPWIEGELARSHSRFAQGASQILGAAVAVQRAKVAARVAPGVDPSANPPEVEGPLDGGDLDGGATDPGDADANSEGGEGPVSSEEAPVEPAPWVASPEDDRLMDLAVERAVAASRTQGGAPPDEEAIRRIVGQVFAEQRGGGQ